MNYLYNFLGAIIMIPELQGYHVIIIVLFVTNAILLTLFLYASAGRAERDYDINTLRAEVLYRDDKLNRIESEKGTYFNMVKELQKELTEKESEIDHIRFCNDHLLHENINIKNIQHAKENTITLDREEIKQSVGTIEKTLDEHYQTGEFIQELSNPLAVEPIKPLTVEDMIDKIRKEAS